MRFIIGLDEHCLRLQADIDHWRKTKGLAWLNRGLTLDEARDLSFAMVQKLFHDSMLWREPGQMTALEMLDVRFATLYPGYAYIEQLAEAEYDRANDFYVSVLDPFFLAMMNIVSQVNGDAVKTWNVINISRKDATVKRDQTVINERGKECFMGTEETIIQANLLVTVDGDYRILDWQRRTRSGEWRHRHPRGKNQPAPDKTVSEAQENSDRFDDINNQVLKQTADLRKSKTLGIQTLGRSRRVLQ